MYLQMASGAQPEARAHGVMELLGVCERPRTRRWCLVVAQRACFNMLRPLTPSDRVSRLLRPCSAASMCPAGSHAAFNQRSARHRSC